MPIIFMLQHQDLVSVNDAKAGRLACWQACEKQFRLFNYSAGFAFHFMAISKRSHPQPSILSTLSNNVKPWTCLPMRIFLFFFFFHCSCVRVFRDLLDHEAKSTGLCGQPEWEAADIVKNETGGSLVAGSIKVKANKVFCPPWWSSFYQQGVDETVHPSKWPSCRLPAMPVIVFRLTISRLLFFFFNLLLYLNFFFIAKFWVPASTPIH